MTSKVKTAILLFNLGGPGSIPEVKPFLTRLFSDPDLIELPMSRSSLFNRILALRQQSTNTVAQSESADQKFKSLLSDSVVQEDIPHVQKLFADVITKRRCQKIENQYQQIGGQSPIKKWTTLQMEKMVKLLDQVSPQTAPHKPYIAFRYAEPLTQEALYQAINDGAERIIGFTQYPQYSCSTTGSSLNELATAMRRLKPELRDKLKMSFIDRWPIQKGLVEAFAQNIKSKLDEFPAEDRNRVLLLFSAHSLPMSVVDRGDTYPQEVAATVQAVMERLGHSNPYRLSWQSKVGPSRWLSPQTADVVNMLGKKSHQKDKNVIIVPVAFTSDHIETLFEIDIELMEDAHKLGLNMKRCDSLNDSETFIRGMVDLVKDHIDSGFRCSQQLHMQCPGCQKQSCRNMRETLLQQ
ncbi:hypothetical protein MP228_004450 [Amoeboaphelidium protococcarum]|nr:hypothetical protein MP228_004450 [Amoeboaphelidium protococcarum]